MPIKDQYHDLKGEIALNIQAISSNITTVGNTIDLQGYESITFFPVQGTVTDGDYAYKLFVGDASNMSDEVEVTTAAGGLLGTLPSYTADTDDNKIGAFGYHGNKRYIRIKTVSTNVTTGGTVGAVSVKGNAHREAVN